MAIKFPAKSYQSIFYCASRKFWYNMTKSETFLNRIDAKEYMEDKINTYATLVRTSDTYIEEHAIFL
jgi:hypothetical protein